MRSKCGCFELVFFIDYRKGEEIFFKYFLHCCSCVSGTSDELELSKLPEGNDKLLVHDTLCGKRDPFSITFDAYHPSILSVCIRSSLNDVNFSTYNEPGTFFGFEANYEFLNESEISSDFRNSSSGNSNYI